jgi:uncharacterized membrane protein
MSSAISYQVPAASPTRSTGIEQGRAQSSTSVVNVGDNERLITGAVGGLLLLAGLRKSMPGLLLSAIGGVLLHRAYTGHSSAYAAMGIDTAHRAEGARPEDYFENSIHVEESFMIQKLPEELYRFWRNFENLPKFMRHLESVKCADGTHSHWVAVGPADYRVEWDAQIINDEPNRLIAWRSLGNADVDNAGSVRFLSAPGGRRTEVKVVIDYIPPGGKVGQVIAKLFGRAPEQQIREDLRRFKQLMEAGEIPTTEAQATGPCVGKDQ